MNLSGVTKTLADEMDGSVGHGNQKSLVSFNLILCLGTSARSEVQPGAVAFL